MVGFRNILVHDYAMSLRIACDLDGTIADMEGALQREAERLFGPDVVVRPVGSEHLEAPVEQTGVRGQGAGVRAVSGTRDEESTTAAEAGDRRTGKPLTSRELRHLWKHVAGIENFWTTLKEIESGAVARIAGLRSKHSLEVIFLTQRPETAGEIAQLQSQRWLETHGFELPAVYVLRGSRGLAAAALDIDVVLDDRKENCLEVAIESKARSMLVWRDPPDTVPPAASRLGIETVFSIAEAVQRIEETIMRPPPKETLVSRLRNAIGV